MDQLFRDKEKSLADNVQCGFGEFWKTLNGGFYLVMSCCAPVGDALRISDAFLQAVGSEGAECYGGRAVQAADGPEGRHTFRSAEKGI